MAVVSQANSMPPPAMVTSVMVWGDCLASVLRCRRAPARVQRRAQGGGRHMVPGGHPSCRHSSSLIRGRGKRPWETPPPGTNWRSLCPCSSGRCRRGPQVRRRPQTGPPVGPLTDVAMLVASPGLHLTAVLGLHGASSPSASHHLMFLLCCTWCVIGTAVPKKPSCCRCAPGLPHRGHEPQRAGEAAVPPCLRAAHQPGHAV